MVRKGTLLILFLAVAMVINVSVYRGTDFFSRGEEESRGFNIKETFSKECGSSVCLNSAMDIVSIEETGYPAYRFYIITSIKPSPASIEFLDTPYNHSPPVFFS